MTGVEELEGRLAELRSERAAVEVLKSKEELARDVDGWLDAARARAAGSSRYVLSGRPVGEDLEALLAEDLLDDSALAGRVVKRLQAQGFGAISDRAKKQQLAKFDQQIEQATAELLKARKAAAIAAVEREYSSVGEAASL